MGAKSAARDFCAGVGGGARRRVGRGWCCPSALVTFAQQARLAPTQFMLWQRDPSNPEPFPTTRNHVHQPGTTGTMEPHVTPTIRSTFQIAGTTSISPELPTPLRLAFPHTAPLPSPSSRQSEPSLPHIRQVTFPPKSRAGIFSDIFEGDLNTFIFSKLRT